MNDFEQAGGSDCTQNKEGTEASPNGLFGLWPLESSNPKRIVNFTAQRNKLIKKVKKNSEVQNL